MTVRVALLAAASVFVGASALAQTAPAQPSSTSVVGDAAAFGSREGVEALNLSPDGTHLVYVAPARDRWSAVMVVNNATGDVKPIAVSRADPQVLRWCNFASNDRLVCRFSATIRGDTGDLIGYSRLVSMNLDGSDMKELGQHASFYDADLRQFDGAILDWRAGPAGQVMMEREYVPETGRTGSRMVQNKRGGVDIVDTRTAKATAVESPRPGVEAYMTDGQGKVRLMSMAQVDGENLTGRVKYYYRATGSKDWRDLTDYVDADDFQALAVDATTDSLYALKKLGGRMALYRVHLDGSKAEDLVASNPNVDIDDVVRVGNGLKVIGYTFAEDRRRAIYFDPEFGNLALQLAKTLPKTPQVTFAGASADGRQLLIFAGGAEDPGRYYLFDKQTRELNQLLDDRPEISSRSLGTVTSISYKADDGTAVPAYLTLPPGKATAKGLPAVVLPHGGPSARDEWGFDWLAQFLAVRGYAVIQPNYRGSAGFGDQWLMNNGFKSWRTSIGDISAAARYLSSSGIADPNRIAIVGWSYGGYAALQSAVTEPSLYKAVVAVAPVTDLALLKTEAQDYTNTEIVARFVGSGPHVVEGSPLRHAAAITVPVLLVHGDKDTNVDIEQSDKMNAALKSAGKQVEYLRFSGLDHQLEDSAVRTQMLTRIAALLDRTIGH